jgi:hypothetical protein
MFGYFQFAQPQFADVPYFSSPGPAASGGGGGPPGKRRKNPFELSRQEQADRMERMLMEFLKNQ